MNKRLKQKKGITLIALVITIIVLLILAGVSIAMLTGDNGILTQANNAKTQTEIGTEKEQLSLAVTDVKTNGLAIGENLLNQTNLQKALDNVAGAGKTQVDGEGILSVFFTDSERTYYVTADGEVLENLNEMDQSDIYTYTQDGYITGVKEEYLKNNQDYGENGKYASTGNIKIAIASPQYYLVDELNGTLIIPSQIGDTKIIGIDNYAFNYILNLKQVIISVGIINIGDEAFYQCRELNDISLPNSLQSIGGWVFYDCDGLNSITIPSGVRNIGEDTFLDCDNLEKIIIKAKEGVISGEPWGANYETTIIYQDEYTQFAEEYLTGKSIGELEELMVKSMLYPGTFDEYLVEGGMNREDIEKIAEENGMTYEEFLENSLIEYPMSWIAVEYYSEVMDFNGKSVSELKQLFKDASGQSIDEFLASNSEMFKSKEELMTKYSEEEILKYCLNYVANT